MITPIVLEPVDTFTSVFHNIKYQTIEPSVFNMTSKTKFQKIDKAMLVPVGSASLAIWSASEVAKSELAGVTAK